MHDVVTELCLDQRKRWEAGDRLLVETYLEREPGLRGRPDAILDLIYNEVMLREAAGDHPALEDYVQRFPQLADALRHQFQIHRAIEDALLSHTQLDNTSRSNEVGMFAPGWSLSEIPGYEILEEIGHGGMGVVYQARHLRLNRLVALKLMRAGFLAGTHERQRFKTEAEAVARLQHPHIVQIFEVGEHEGLPYLALELVAGPSLEKLPKPLPASAAAGLVQTLALALAHVHQQGIVHRDLKPANILMTPAAEPTIGHPKITDFGLAKLNDGLECTASMSPIGTPHYMSPEQALGRSADVGPLSDVYALGAILYELLTGRTPFEGIGPLDVLDRVRTQEPRPPSLLCPALPRDLETICLKCLRKSPGERYASALALAEDLSRFLAQEPIHARPAGPWERAVKWTKRRPALAGALALAVALIALPFLLAWQHDQNLQAARQDERLTQLEHLQQARAQLQAFEQQRSDAAFNWISSTLNAKYERASQADVIKTTARKALALANIDTDRLTAPTFNAYWSAREQAEVQAGCYQLSLVLADVEGSHDARRGLALLDRAATVFPPTQALHLRRAHFLWRLNDEPGARRAQAAALALPPASAIDFFLLGDWWYQQRKVEEAAERFRQALENDAADFWSRYYLAVCQIDLHRPADARATLTKCLERKPDFTRALLLRGRAQAELNEADAAERDFTAALRLERNEDGRYVLYVSRGRLHLGCRQYDLALRDLTQALALHRPNPSHAYFNLALLHQAQKEWDKSNEALAEVIQLRPSREMVAECHVERGRNFYRAREFGAAVQAADAALGALADNAEAYERRAFALLELKRYEEAKDSFSAFLNHHGKPDADFYRGRGQAHMQLGDFLAAKDDYTQALDLDPRADLYAHRGWAYFFADAWKPALRDFEEAVRRDPAEADSYVGRGLAHVMLGHVTEALADAASAVRRQPHTPEMMHNVACTFALASARPEKLTAAQVADCRDRALDAIRKTLTMVPAAERRNFWQTKILPDPALAPLRSTAGFRELSEQMAESH